MNDHRNDGDAPYPGVKLAWWRSPPEWGTPQRLGMGLAGPPDAPAWIKLPVEILAFPNGRNVMRLTVPIHGYGPPPSHSLKLPSKVADQGTSP